jgi:Ca-activated chloride channel family protein
MEVPAGHYKVTFQALVMKGNDTYFEVDKVEVKSNTTTPLTHNFETGKAMIGVKTANGELIDAGVTFLDVNSGKRITGARTYTSEKNNPRGFLLNPGTYKVDIKSLGVHVGKNKTITIEVKKGETVTEIITF